MLCSQSLCSADFWEEPLDFGKSLISCAKAPSHGSCVEEAMLHGSCWRQTLPVLGSCRKEERREYCSWKLGFGLGVLCSPVRATVELRMERGLGRGLISSHRCPSPSSSSKELLKGWKFQTSKDWGNSLLCRRESSSASERFAVSIPIVFSMFLEFIPVVPLFSLASGPRFLGSDISHLPFPPFWEYGSVAKAW